MTATTAKIRNILTPWGELVTTARYWTVTTWITPTSSRSVHFASGDDALAYARSVADSAPTLAVDVWGPDGGYEMF